MNKNRSLKIITKANGDDIYSKFDAGNIEYWYSCSSEGYHSKTGLQICWKNDNNKVLKELTMHKNFDYNFVGSFEDVMSSSEQKEIDFLIKKDNLIYKPLVNFLNEDNEITIDDDTDTVTDKKRYMSISQGEDSNISIKFVNNKTEADYTIDNDSKRVFIKNILIGFGSKIDRQNLDTNGRLVQLFLEINKVFLDKIKMEKYEYSLLKYLDDEER